MDDEIIQDLKQFISKTVFNEIQGVRDDIKSVKNDIKDLDTKLTVKIDDLSVSVGTVIGQINDFNDNIFNDHERRIKKLESKV